MTHTYQKLYAVKVMRCDGKFFLAYSDNKPCGLWSNRIGALNYRDQLNTEYKIAMRRMKVVKVSVAVSDPSSPLSS
jgi:hypothetical protein